MKEPNYNFIRKKAKNTTLRGVLYPFFGLHLEFDKNADSIDVSIVFFVSI